MCEVWAVIAVVVILMVIYGYVSSMLRKRKQRKAREKSLPFVEDNVRAGCRYNVCLSDSRKFENVELVGSSTVADGQFSFAGWEGMLVLKYSNGKRLFLRQSAVRYIEEL